MPESNHFGSDPTKALRCSVAAAVLVFQKEMGRGAVTCNQPRGARRGDGCDGHGKAADHHGTRKRGCGTG